MGRLLLNSIYFEEPVSGLTHTFFPYPARAPPIIPRELIQSLSKPGDVVLDPFCGGGTTVVEAMATGRRAIGNDLNPLANYVTQVKSALITPSILFSRISQFREALDKQREDTSDPDDAIFDERERAVIPKVVRNDIVLIRELINNTSTNTKIQKLLMLALAASCSSLQDKRTISTFSLRDSFLRRLNDMQNGMADLYSVVGPKAIPLLTTYDATNLTYLLGDLVPKANFVFTSPPYKDLHVEYAELMLRGRVRSMLLFKILGLKYEKKNYIFTSPSYFDMMDAFAQELRRALRSASYAAILIGFKSPEDESRFVRTFLSNGLNLVRKWRRPIKKTYKNRRMWRSFLLEKENKILGESVFLFRNTG